LVYRKFNYIKNSWLH